MPRRISRPVWRRWDTISTKRRNIRARHSFTARLLRFFLRALLVRSESSMPVERSTESWPSTRQSTMSCSRPRSCSLIRCSSALHWEASGESGRCCRTTPVERDGLRTGIPGHANSWLSTIEEAASRKEAEREYLGRGDWKRLTKRMSVLPRKANFTATPDFSKIAAPRKALRAFVADTQRAGSRLLFVAAVGDDLRAMERLSGIKAELFADWDEAKAGRSREGALLADFDAGFAGSGRKPLVVVTASDV